LDVGLSAGDIVVEVDGVAIENVAQGRELMESAVNRESTTWVVLRNGVRVNVTFNVRDFRESGLGLHPVRVD
jgi:S1-C subfamily serine protease